MSDEMQPEKHLIVVASNPQQMQVAQAQMVSWVDKKLEIISAERNEAWNTLETAKKNKWKAGPFKKVHDRLVDQHQFYEKLKAALEAGYTIIPNFEDIDIFAVRTAKEQPDRHWASQDARYGKVIPSDQASESPPVGEGQYVNATAEYTQRKLQAKIDDKGQPVYVQQAWATDHATVEFPFKMVKPEILVATKQAMDHFIFDDIGCVPGRRRARRGDPMIIGRIHCHPHVHHKFQHRTTYEKTLSFLITWFINTRDL